MADDTDIEQDINMFSPPLAHGLKVLDRGIFRKTVALKAARVFENKNISKIRSQLERSKDALQQDRLANVLPDPDPEQAKMGRKCILLRPEVRQEALSLTKSETRQTNGHVKDSDTNGVRGSIRWPYSTAVTELTQQNLTSVIPYDLDLDYNYWTYHDIISAILPENLQNEIPSGFSQVGHIVHINLREAYLPYKYLIAAILIDKNIGATTVINKIDDVGEENAYRTFKYEILAGEDNMNVVVSEAGCEFRFDYSKVYWNPRLSTEHRRLVEMFKEGEAVCDVMAGIGPFAVPAGKKNVFVWANDLNPDSYSCLTDAVKRNKAVDFVKPSCQDGRAFIRDSARQLLQEDKRVAIRKKVSRHESQKKEGAESEVVRTIAQPKTFQHYALNLPASALTFLPSFVGLYPPQLREQLPPQTIMPLIHVYCFSTKDEQVSGLSPQQNSNESAVEKICAEISEHLQFQMRPGKIADTVPGSVEVWDVRDVAPKKRMFCASFRLPEDVAFHVR